MFPDEKHPSYGVFVKQFCEQLQEMGIDYTLSVMYKADDKISKLFNYVCFYFKTLLKAIFGSYDIIYVHYPSYSAAPLQWVSRIKKYILFTNLHGSDVIPENRKHEKMQKYTRWAVGHSQKIVVPSEYFKNIVATKYAVNKNHIVVYPSGGVNSSVFNNKEENLVTSFKKQNGLDINKATVGIAGRISKGKGWDTFSFAVKKLIDQEVDANYWIVGEGDENRELNRVLKELMIEDKVIWTKRLLPQDELALFFNACDYFVFPTKREGESLGLVGVEAMACGTPVIASDFAAPKYYVIDGVNGFKFEKGNSDNLYKTIMRALRLEEEEKEKLSKGARITSNRYCDIYLKEDFKKLFKDYI